MWCLKSGNPCLTITVLNIKLKHRSILPDSLPPARNLHCKVRSEERAPHMPHPNSAPHRGGVGGGKGGAGDEIRTRDIYLGKVVLYQLSYSRNEKTPALTDFSGTLRSE